MIYVCSVVCAIAPQSARSFTARNRGDKRPLEITNVVDQQKRPNSVVARSRCGTVSRPCYPTPPVVARSPDRATPRPKVSTVWPVGRPCHNSDQSQGRGSFARFPCRRVARSRTNPAHRNLRARKHLPRPSLALTLSTDERCGAKLRGPTALPNHPPGRNA